MGSKKVCAGNGWFVGVAGFVGRFIGGGDLRMRLFASACWVGLGSCKSLFRRGLGGSVGPRIDGDSR